MQGVVSRGTLRASLQVDRADVFVIAVPTPFGNDHVPDASYVMEAATNVAAELIDIDEALESCGMMITLTDHDMFKSIPLDERAGKVVYDTRGIWPDQPDNRQAVTDLRRVS